MVGQDLLKAKTKRLSSLVTKATADLLRISNSTFSKTLQEQASSIEAIKQKASSMQAFNALLMVQNPDIDDYVNLLSQIIAYPVIVSPTHQDYAVSLVGRQCMTHRNFDALITIFTGTHACFQQYCLAEGPGPEGGIAPSKHRVIQTVFKESTLEAINKLQIADVCRAPTPNKSVLIDIHNVIIHTKRNGLGRLFVDRRELNELKVLTAMLDPHNVPVTELIAALEAQASGHVVNDDVEAQDSGHVVDDDVEAQASGHVNSAPGPILKVLMEGTVGLRFVVDAKIVAQSRQGEVQCEQCFEKYKDEVDELVAGGGFYFRHPDTDSRTVTLRGDMLDSKPFADFLANGKALQALALALINKKKKASVLEAVNVLERKVWIKMAESFESMAFQNTMELAMDVVIALEKESS